METSSILLFFLVCIEIFCPPVQCAILRVLFFCIIFKSYMCILQKPIRSLLIPVLYLCIPSLVRDTLLLGISPYSHFRRLRKITKLFANTSNILEENVGCGRFILRRLFSKGKFDLYTNTLQTSLVSIVFHLYVSLSFPFQKSNWALPSFVR